MGEFSQLYHPFAKSASTFYSVFFPTQLIDSCKINQRNNTYKVSFGDSGQTII